METAIADANAAELALIQSGRRHQFEVKLWFPWRSFFRRITWRDASKISISKLYNGLEKKMFSFFLEELHGGMYRRFK